MILIEASLFRKKICICVQTCWCFFLSDWGKFMVSVHWWTTNFSFCNCHSVFTSQFIYTAGEVPTAEPVASLRGKARKPSDCSGKVARVHFEEWNGNTQKGTDAGEKENKMYRIVKTSKGTKHLRKRSGASTQVGKLLFSSLPQKSLSGSQSGN